MWSLIYMWLFKVIRLEYSYLHIIKIWEIGITGNKKQIEEVSTISLVKKIVLIDDISKSQLFWGVNLAVDLKFKCAFLPLVRNFLEELNISMWNVQGLSSAALLQLKKYINYWILCRIIC